MGLEATAALQLNAHINKGIGNKFGDILKNAVYLKVIFS